MARPGAEQRERRPHGGTSQDVADVVSFDNDPLASCQEGKPKEIPASVRIEPAQPNRQTDCGRCVGGRNDFKWLPTRSSVRNGSQRPNDSVA